MAINLGTNIASVPAPVKQALGQNYIDFATAGSSDGWAQQFMPELVQAEAERYGKRTISGFLSQVGAEEGMTSDQVVWSEQGRLHLKTTGSINGTSASVAIDGIPTGHAIRVADTIIVSNLHRNVTLKCYVMTVATNAITVAPYTAAHLTGGGMTADNDPVTILVYGSEFGKGTNGRAESVTPSFKSFTNKPIIIKDKYHIDGSDTAQIGWVEVSGEDGQSGYLWYLKADGDTRARFTDYLEMSMVEAVKKDSGHASAPDGSEGLFAAIEDRGIMSNAALALSEFDLILAEFDGQGAIEENMLYLDRTESLVVDDMLAGLDGGSTGSGSAYGVFNNSQDMAINLGFKGFRRGSYDFYKTDWKYLNDAANRGAIPATNTTRIRGCAIPAGVSSVYDENLGKNLKRPFLHVRYRTSAADDRRFKTWITGSVGGNITSDLDAMQVHYLSERCLVVQAANNFLLLN